MPSADRISNLCTGSMSPKDSSLAVFFGLISSKEQQILGNLLFAGNVAGNILQSDEADRMLPAIEDDSAVTGISAKAVEG